MDKGLFGFLKSRAIFTQGGAKDYHEYVTKREQQTENNNRARKGFKKAKKKY
jgi:hypothetical protein